MTGCPKYPTKQRYDKWEYAHNRLVVLRKSVGNDLLQVYLCPHCNGHHIGGIHLEDEGLLSKVPMAGSYAKGPSFMQESKPPRPLSQQSIDRARKMARVEENIRKQEELRIEAAERKNQQREQRDREVHEAQLAIEIANILKRA